VKPRCRWEDNIEIERDETVLYDVNNIYLAQDVDHLQDIMYYIYTDNMYNYS
jgi:hypothetical protein